MSASGKSSKRTWDMQRRLAHAYPHPRSPSRAPPSRIVLAIVVLPWDAEDTQPLETS